MPHGISRIFDIILDAIHAGTVFVQERKSWAGYARLAYNYALYLYELSKVNIYFEIHETKFLNHYCLIVNCNLKDIS